MPRSRLPAILVVAALLRLALLAAMWPDDTRLLRQDTFASYLPLVQGLVERGEFTATPGEVETIRTPGYPAFLALLHLALGPSPWRAVLVQVLLSLAVVWLAAQLGRAAGGAACGDLAALVIALDPVSMLHAVTLLSETLFTALVTVAVLAAWRSGDRLVVGEVSAGALALGLAALVRPIALYVIPLYVLWLALATAVPLRRRLAVAALALALAAAAPLAWMARNQALGAGFLLSSIEGLNALYYRAAPALACAQGISWDDANEQLETELARRAPPGTPAAESMRAASGLALEVLRAHPAAAALVVLDGAVRMWAGPGAGDLMVVLDVADLGAQAHWPQRGPAARRALAVLAAVLAWLAHTAIAALAVAGLASWWRDRRWRALAFATVLLGAFTLLSASPGAYARFRAPVMPVVAVLTAAGALALRGRADWC